MGRVYSIVGFETQKGLFAHSRIHGMSFGRTESLLACYFAYFYTDVCYTVLYYCEQQ